MKRSVPPPPPSRRPSLQSKGSSSSRSKLKGIGSFEGSSLPQRSGTKGPVRLRDGGGGEFERWLVDAAAFDAPSTASASRVAAALGIVGAAPWEQLATARTSSNASPSQTVSGASYPVGKSFGTPKEGAASPVADDAASGQDAGAASGASIAGASSGAQLFAGAAKWVVLGSLGVGAGIAGTYAVRMNDAPKAASPATTVSLPREPAVLVEPPPIAAVPVAPASTREPERPEPTDLLRPAPAKPVSPPAKNSPIPEPPPATRSQNRPALATQRLAAPDEESEAPTKLLQEVRWLDRVEAQLAAGAPEEAARLLAEYTERFVEGQLRVEANVLRARTLWALGRRKEAGAIARQLLTDPSAARYRPVLTSLSRSDDSKGSNGTRRHMTKAR